MEKEILSELKLINIQLGKLVSILSKNVVDSPVNHFDVKTDVQKRIEEARRNAEAQIAAHRSQLG